MKKLLLVLTLGLSFVQTAVAVEGDADAGKAKSAVCAACHGANGLNAIPSYPDLAGQHGAYIAKQLKGFQNGDRSDPMMSPMAANLSEQDMADLGAYFESQPRTAAEAPAGSAPVAVAGSAGAPAASNGDPAYDAGQTKSASCAACHGADGNSAVTMYPKLAGQGKPYIVKQLAEFKSGTRSDPVMGPMAAALSEEDMNNIATFFARQKITDGNGETNEIGQKLFVGGNAAKEITACAGCHSIDGKGMPQAAFPSVAGQNVEYLTSQLNKFRSGERTNDRNNIMANIAVKLSDSEIDALAQYMSSLKN